MECSKDNQPLLPAQIGKLLIVPGKSSRGDNQQGLISAVQLEQEIQIPVATHNDCSMPRQKSGQGQQFQDDRLAHTVDNHGN
jgi:hypothetical protein